MNVKALLNHASLSTYITSIAIFITVILGIIWQGGELFWFGPAGASAAALFFFFLNKNYKKSIILPSSPINTLLILFTGWCFLTVILSDVPAISVIRAFTIGSAVIGLYCYYFITNTLLSWGKIWNAIVAAGLVLFIYSCIEVYIGIPAPNSLFFNKNTHAAYLNLIILPTAAYFLITTHSRYRFFLGIALFALIFSHALPGSRGATFGQFIGLGMILLVGIKHISKRTLAQFFLIYVSAFTLATLFTSNLLRFFEYKIKDVDVGRWEIWEGAINLLKDTPWYGSGVGTYWLLHPAYRHINETSSGQNAHNDYLQYLIETGIPGLALLLLLMLSIIYFWWNLIKNPDNDSTAKIEASGLTGGLVAIGFHAFFTFNLGLFSILFLAGLLLGRLIFLMKHTKNTRLLQHIPIRKSIFSLAVSSIFIVFGLYFATISIFSHLYISAATYHRDGNISQADKLNAIAMSIYPFDDRPYLLYVQIYQSILSEINELNEQEKRFFYNKSLAYLEQAKRINPHIGRTDYLHAKLIELNPEFAGPEWKKEVINLYQKSLKSNPMYLPPTRRLANFYISQGEIQQASNTVYNAIKYSYPGSKETLEFYNFAEKIFLQSGNSTHLTLLHLKKENLLESFSKRGIKIEDKDLKNSE